MAAAIVDLFNWKPPTDGDVQKYASVRAAALSFAQTVSQLCPNNADAVTAVYKIREAWFFANEAIQGKQ